MCNEYRLKRTSEGWAWVHVGGDAVIKDGEEDFFDVFPDRIAPVVAKSKDGTPTWRDMRWGFPPPSAGARPVTNVRNTASGFWRNWLEPRWRVVVPFDEFVEFTDATPKRKYYFSTNDNQPAAFAGIWRPWTGIRGTKSAPIDGEHLLYAILTTAPNTLVAPIHAKAMPVLLVGEDEQRAWLEGSVEDALAFQARVFPPERLRAREAIASDKTAPVAPKTKPQGDLFG